MKRNDLPAYMFRAECLKDVLRLRREAAGAFSAMTVQFDDRLPDVTVTIQTETICLFEAGIRACQNGHVMLETLNTAQQYTGARTYTQQSWLQGWEGV